MGAILISVLIVAEVRLYRDGLVLALRQESGIEIVSVCRHLVEACAEIRRLRPDIVVLDMLMDDCLSVLRSLHVAQPSARIVAIGVSEDENEIVTCAEFGICGLVHRDGTLRELVTTLKCAMQGEFWCSPRAAAAIARRVVTLSSSGHEQQSNSPLTARETQVVGLIDHGLSNKDIARKLGIEVATVKNHVHNVLDKLKVRRRGQAAAELRRHAASRMVGRSRRPPSSLSP